MRKDFGSQTWVVPMPVLILGTYDENGKPNVMNAAWGGTYDTNMVFVCLAEHKTTDNLKVSKAFTISFADIVHMAACDYVGIVSGKNEPDKFYKAGFTETRSKYVNAPIINELPMTLECEMVSFNDGILIGRIVNVSADSSVLDVDGKPSVQKLKLISYDPIHHKYVEVKGEVGDAFKIGKLISK